jgi:HAD superfamily hydrolase (TIGR01490 family)
VIAAFFDMDETLLTVNSATLWVRHMWRLGELSNVDLIRSLLWLAGYKMAIIDMERVARSVVRQYAGVDEEEMRESVSTWYQETIRETISPSIRAEVRLHESKGHRTVLLTASSPYLSKLVANEVGMDAVLCSSFEVAEGRLTGNLNEPFCYGHGKVVMAEAWAQDNGVDLDQSYFYTDSYTDLPMLERVKFGVAVNPDPRLLRHARKTGVPIRQHS